MCYLGFEYSNNLKESHLNPAMNDSSLLNRGFWSCWAIWPSIACLGKPPWGNNELQKIPRRFQENCHEHIPVYSISIPWNYYRIHILLFISHQYSILFPFIFILIYYENYSHKYLGSREIHPNVTNKHTVDGRNPAPVDRWFTTLFIGGFNHPRWCRISQPSTVSP